MTTMLTKHGDGWAIVIDPPLLAQLKIGPDTPLHVSADAGALRIVPAAESDRSAKFASALDAANRQYGRALAKLAE